MGSAVLLDSARSAEIKPRASHQLALVKPRQFISADLSQPPMDNPTQPSTAQPSPAQPSSPTLPSSTQPSSAQLSSVQPSSAQLNLLWAAQGCPHRPESPVVLMRKGQIPDPWPRLKPLVFGRCPAGLTPPSLFLLLLGACSPLPLGA